MSEIDDIFASKASAPPVPSSSKSSKKKKKKKVQEPSSPNVAPKKRPAPETVVDTSDLLVGSSKRHKPNDEEKKPKPSKTDKKPDVDPDFKDSRGTANRRTTEEGWFVYKEDELGISNEGGDTPLCPFDCECCY